MDIRNQIFFELQKLNAPDTLLKEVEHTELQILLSWVPVIDESRFSLNEWCEALVSFKNWEAENGKFLTLSHKLEYLSCCTEGESSAGKLQTLSALLAEYLRSYGVE